ncbi:MAG: THUMP domain-containing protein [Candidatus Bathyarchaeia archaeon]|nr:methyltransferase domain-containing protein [Candidatus Bathyarchaeota archaeon]
MLDSLNRYSSSSNNVVDFMVTTIPGLEDIVFEEAREKINVLDVIPRFGDVGGRVLLRVPRNQCDKVFTLRSIEHIIELVGTFKVGSDKNGLDQIYSGVYSFDIPLGSTFRVTCERVGSHKYTSIDVQRIAGQALVDKYGRRVNLKNPETIVRVDVAYDLCIVGLQKTRTSLRIRYPRMFQHYSALNPIIAYAMLRIAGVRSGDRVLDPFCGGGTIIIEAAQAWSGLELIGVDISPKSIEGAWMNAEAAGVRDKVNFIVGDARRLERVLSRGWRADKVVSNLPFGIRSGRLKVIPPMYTDFLKSVRQFLNEDSKVCLLTLHNSLLKSIAEDLGYKVIGSRWILQGGLKTWIMLLSP